jgi:hypothetical protein
MKEKTIEERFRDKIKEMKGLALKFFCVSFTGVPDRLVLMPGGRIWFVELKAPGKKTKFQKGLTTIPETRQDLVIKQLRGLGLNVFIIDSHQEVDEFLNLIAK